MMREPRLHVRAARGAARRRTSLTRDELATFVRDNAWGHHASCTCKMGRRRRPDGGRRQRFRVHGTRNLRVVDASVFPRIPGFFIVTPIYMISEKASDVILADAGAAVPARRHAGVS